MNYDNPAARLLAIIENGKSISAHVNCRVAWEQLLDVENNNPLLISRLGKVMELPDSIIQAIKENFPNQQDTWSHWSTQVNHAFMVQNLNANWQTFINEIDQHSVTYLRLASDLLQVKSNTKILIDGEISPIRERLLGLLEEVLSGNLSDDIKKYLARNIRKIIVSIEEYKITGALPLLDSIESTIGHAHIDEPYKNFLVDTELGRRILDTLGAMSNLVTVAVGIPQLSQTIALLTN